jgi:flagellar FliL protein
MADEEGQESGGKSGGGLLRIIILVVPALLIGVGGGYFLGSSLTKKHYEDKANMDPQAVETPKDPMQLVGEMVKLETFLVNLNEPKGNRYLKASIQLEIADDKIKSELDRRQAQVRDIILQLLSSKNTQELQASDGKFRLREELLSRINALLVNGAVSKVYFTEFVIQ